MGRKKNTQKRICPDCGSSKNRMSVRCRSCASRRVGRYATPRISEDLTGRIFGGLQVISRLPNGSRGRVFWECKCIACGSSDLLKRRDDYLKSNPPGCRSCVFRNNAKKVKVGNKSKCWKGTKDISKTHINHIKRQCTRPSRTLEFSITPSYLQDLLEKQNYKCALTGIPLITHSDAKRNSIKPTLSLDRINSEEGYKIDNVQWVHKTVNIMKHKLTTSEFIEFCGLVWSHHANTRLST
jgi:hypothetical protein